MQLPLNLPVSVPKSAYDYGTRTSGEVHGVVLTKPHVVELLLDLSGYTEDRELFAMRLLEPSCGHGAFLVPAVRRLLCAARRAGRDPSSLSHCMLAFDIDESHVEVTKNALCETLEEFGVQSPEARALVDGWVHHGDFLIASIESSFDVVVGNPPYIRIEQLSPVLQAEYRRRYSTLFDRADIYVAFIERSLTLLSDGGVLSFICADRWTVNRYGAPLRKFISKEFGVRAFVDLHTASPFESEVIAYPSIFSLSRHRVESIPVISLSTANETECASVIGTIEDDGKAAPGVAVARYADWFDGDDPWVLSSPEQLSVLRTLESKFQPIETTAKVGIGVATGCDRLYVVGAEADIESDRLVPLVMRDNIQAGLIVGANQFVINTFSEDGSVVDLATYPRLRRYLEENGGEIRKRHVSQKNPKAWFRTIDRVYPELVARPKLLIPDIAGSNQVAFDEGRYHPHHNLYFVVSDRWDLEILGGLLSSRVVLFFVWSYAVKMRGGYLRFQAQYLRRIRLPNPAIMKSALGQRIKDAFRDRDFKKLDGLALDAYELPSLPPFDFVDTRS